MKSFFLTIGLVLGVMQAASAADFSFSRPVRLTLERNAAGSVAIGDANGDGGEGRGPHQSSACGSRRIKSSMACPAALPS